MNVHSLKTLFGTVFLGGGVFVYRLVKFEGFVDLVWLCFIAYLILQGLTHSFSKEAYDADVSNAAYGKCVYRKLFGRFAPVAPYVPFLLILLGGVITALLPSWAWLKGFLLLLLLSALVYAVWLSVIYKKHMRLAKEQTSHDNTD